MIQVFILILRVLDYFFKLILYHFPSGCPAVASPALDTSFFSHAKYIVSYLLFNACSPCTYHHFCRKVFPNLSGQVRTHAACGEELKATEVCVVNLRPHGTLSPSGLLMSSGMCSTHPLLSDHLASDSQNTQC